ncbi:hypothetical protein [Bacillus safensis]|uniref:hypothetical protein n=1 Tax=Bacillus safensis TaxID=561879 RepID=UPI002E1CCC7C|nr:hypothetical protein [Bacillus safensis]
MKFKRYELVKLLRNDGLMGYRDTKAGSIGMVLFHDQVDDSVDVDFHYEETNRRLTDRFGIIGTHDEGGNSRDDIADTCTIEPKDLERIKTFTMHTENFQHFKGRVWITKHDLDSDCKGVYACIPAKEGFQKIFYFIATKKGYTHDHKKYYTLDEIVKKGLSSLGLEEFLIDLHLGDNLFKKKGESNN